MCLMNFHMAKRISEAQARESDENSNAMVITGNDDGTAERVQSKNESECSYDREVRKINEG